jgi:hypothetical protein
MEGQLISDIKEAQNNIRKESIAINEKNNQIENTKRHLVSARTDLDHAYFLMRMVSFILHDYIIHQGFIGLFK